MGYGSAYVSQIGHACAVEALLREGFNVATPVVDMGYDLLAIDPTGRCWRIQVKAATARAGTRSNRRIHLTRGWRRNKEYDASHIDAFLLVNLRTRDVLCLPVREAEGRRYIAWDRAASHGGVTALRRLKARRC